MATTPKYALRYPVDDDPVDVAVDMQKLAEDVELWLGSGGSFVSGVGPPTEDVGDEGSIYFDTDTGEFWGPKTAPGQIVIASDDFERAGTNAPPSSNWSLLVGTGYNNPLTLKGDGHSIWAGLDWARSGCYWNADSAPGDVDVWVTVGKCQLFDGNEAFSLIACMTDNTPYAPSSSIQLTIWDHMVMDCTLGGSGLPGDKLINPRLEQGDQIMLRVRRATSVAEGWVCRISDNKWTQIGSWPISVMPAGENVGLTCNDSYPPAGWTIESFAFGSMPTEEGGAVWPQEPIGGLATGEPEPVVMPPVTELVTVDVPAAAVVDITWPADLPGVVTVAVNVGGGTIRSITYPTFDIGQICTIINPTSAPVTISHNDQQGAGWGFWLRDLAPLVLNKDEAVTFSWVYQTGGLGQFWREISRSVA